MNIKLTNGKPATEDAIKALQDALKCQLSESFKIFLRANDGAKPETNIFGVNEKTEGGVNGFIPASEIIQNRTYIENLPPRGYPVAWAQGGNYVFIDEDRNGAVFFWDHEEPENVVEVAPDFGRFLEILEPFDVRSVELKPGQLKKVWVDPEFAKRFKKK
jgi:hypothetical protein